jgi:hypothetical protein
VGARQAPIILRGLAIGSIRADHETVGGPGAAPGVGGANGACKRITLRHIVPRRLSNLDSTLRKERRSLTIAPP